MNLAFPELLQERHFIGGEWVASEATYDVTDPSSGECLAKVARGGELETRRCIEAAHEALPAWRKHTASERARVVRRWGELMVEHQRDLATLLTAEQGKPFAEAMGEVIYASNFLFWFAEEGRRIYGDVIPSHKPNSRIVVTKEPIGVVGAITPWNFPLAMITRKAGPALASGCTLIVKLSEETPLSALALAVLAERAGVPAGVFNVVSGDALAIGDALMHSTIVRKISFTGSTRTGKILMRQAADTVKHLSLELGGNAPFIVFDDADVDAAVEGAMGSKFRNTGQTCVCVNRFIVQSNIYEAFTSKLAAAADALKVANGFVAGAEQGPLINPAALAKVERHVADALAKGARALCGGRRHSAGNTFYEPTVLRCRWLTRKRSVPSRHVFASKRKTRRCNWRTRPSLDCRPTFTRGIWAVHGVSLRRSRPVWSVSTKGSFPPRSRRSVVSRSPDLVSRVRNTASMKISKSSTC